MAGIYLHVPFCHAKCAYCDFYSVARTELVAKYADAVINEFRIRRCELDGEPVRTLYFGGGTPSILAPDVFKRLAKTLYCDSVEEFTIEANPEDINAESVALWRNLGVNRISLGVQSLIDTELKTVNRRHSTAEALRAIETIRNGGIYNISADLIYGLPGQTSETWQYSVDTLLASGITHLSAYCLSYEPGTLLTRRLSRGEITEASEELIENMYGILCRAASSTGFEHYEISNFAIPGLHSRHNSAYWRNIPYLGLGPGAHSLGADGIRRYNPDNLNTYIHADGLAAECDSESDTDRINDNIMVSLRTAAGLDLQTIPEPYRTAVKTSASPFRQSGHLIQDGAILRIPESSWLLSDAIIRTLFIS